MGKAPSTAAIGGRCEALLAPPCRGRIIAPRMGKIDSTFAALREKRRLALMPFIPVGYPDLATTAALLPALERAGANLIEIGIPFSDPIADGPVVQASFTAALAKGLKLDDVFATIAKARPTVSIPLLAMVSYSIPF